MRIRRGRAAAGLGSATVLCALVVGCGGLPAQQKTDTGAGDVVVAAIDKATNQPVTVTATVVCGGVKGTLKPGDGFVTLKGVPLGTDTPPHQPLTVSAYGYVTNVQQAVLNVSQATYLSAIMEKADVTKTGTITGKVTDEVSAAPITNAVVTLVTETPGTASSVQAFTANDGTYVMGGVPIGVLRATAEAVGYLPYSTEVAVAAEGGAGNLPLNLVLLAGSTKVDVSGQVTDVRTHGPLSGATVVIGSEPAVTTGANGHFTVPQVPVGTQTVKVTLSGYDPYTDSVSVAPGMPTVFVMLNTSSPNPPPGPYTVTGRVSLEGRPDNSGATVTAYDLGRGVDAGATTTDAAGDYFLLLAPGTYRIEAAYGSASASRDVMVLSGRVVRGIDFGLTP